MATLRAQQDENVNRNLKAGVVGQQAVRRPFQDVGNLNQAPIQQGGKQDVPTHGYATRHRTNVLRTTTTQGPAPTMSYTEMLDRRADEGRRSSIASALRQPDLSDIDAADRMNPLAVADYVNDILAYHRRVEPSYMPSLDYMRSQADINEKMRAILIDWLVEVHLKFKLMPETLYLTTSCIDRFLAKKQVTRKNLQLVGVTAMLIASKYEEIWAPEVRDFVYISDKAYTRDQILQMEKIMLNTLGFHLTVPTPYLFLSRFTKAAKADKETSMLSQYLIELALVDYSMIKYPGSLLAAAAVYTASRSRSRSAHECWNATLEKHTKFRLTDLLECASDLTKLQKKAPNGSLQAVFKKYSNPKFNEVARIEHDEELIEM